MSDCNRIGHKDKHKADSAPKSELKLLRIFFTKSIDPAEKLLFDLLSRSCRFEFAMLWFWSLH